MWWLTNLGNTPLIHLIFDYIWRGRLPAAMKLILSKQRPTGMETEEKQSLIEEMEAGKNPPTTNYSETPSKQDSLHTEIASIPNMVCGPKSTFTYMNNIRILFLTKTFYLVPRWYSLKGFHCTCLSLSNQWL